MAIHRRTRRKSGRSGIAWKLWSHPSFWSAQYSTPRPVLSCPVNIKRWPRSLTCNQSLNPPYQITCQLSLGDGEEGWRADSWLSGRFRLLQHWVNNPQTGIQISAEDWRAGVAGWVDTYDGAPHKHPYLTLSPTVAVVLLAVAIWVGQKTNKPGIRLHACSTSVGLMDWRSFFCRVTM